MPAADCFACLTGFAAVSTIRRPRSAVDESAVPNTTRVMNCREILASLHGAKIEVAARYYRCRPHLADRRS